MIGLKLLQLRKEHGKTQEEIARVCNMSQSGYSKAEADLGSFPLDQLPVLAGYYGVSIDELFGYKPGVQGLDRVERCCRFLREYGYSCHKKGSSVLVESFGSSFCVSGSRMERLVSKASHLAKKDVDVSYRASLRCHLGQLLLEETAGDGGGRL